MLTYIIEDCTPNTKYKYYISNNFKSIKYVIEQYLNFKMHIIKVKNLPPLGWITQNHFESLL